MDRFLVVTQVCHGQLIRTRFSRVFSPVVLCLLIFVNPLLGQESSSTDATNSTLTSTENAKVVATVDERSITHADVRRQLARTLGPNAQAYPEVAYKIAVRHLVDQEIVFQYLDSEKRLAGKDEIALRADRLKQELDKVDKTLKEYLAENNVTAQQLKHQVVWEISWRKFVSEKLTEEALRKYFRTHQSKFDGTRLNVAHILWKQKGSPAIEQANVVRESLLAGTQTWADAAKEFSQAASRNNAGEIGWINFDSPMPTLFSNAAYKLAVNEISPPTETAFGIHLIKCLEIEPGKRKFEDVTSQVRADASIELFKKVANQFRKNVQVDFFQ